jgi:hypothetical protein
MRTVIRCLLIVSFLGAGPGAPLNAGAEPARTRSTHKKEDCVRCHPAPVRDMAEAGGKHRSVPCIGCHNGHPPETQKPIAQCSKCHLKTKKAHFEVPGCLDCHRNPHRPLKILLQGKEDACLNCHGQQMALFREHPSKHSVLDCTTCHEVHRKVPQCIQCHLPHSADMVAADCKKCHNPHSPKPATFAAGLPSRYCEACHLKVVELLKATTSRHKPFECARCHQGRHKTIPACQSCHGTPHPEGIRIKFPKCGDCHNIAHDLNNWPVAQPGGTGEEAPKK